MIVQADEACVRLNQMMPFNLERMIVFDRFQKVPDQI